MSPRIAEVWMGVASFLLVMAPFLFSSFARISRDINLSRTFLAHLIVVLCVMALPV